MGEEVGILALLGSCHNSIAYVEHHVEPAEVAVANSAGFHSWISVVADIAVIEVDEEGEVVEEVVVSIDHAAAVEFVYSAREVWAVLEVVRVPCSANLVKVMHQECPVASDAILQVLEAQAEALVVWVHCVATAAWIAQAAPLRKRLVIPQESQTR